MKKQLFLYFAAFAALAVTAQSPRMLLYEEFSGENCGPCAATNPALNALLKQPVNQARVAAIKWEVPIPSAPTKTWSLYLTNKSEIDWRYRSTSSGGYGYISQNNSTSTSNAPNGGINSAPQGRIDGQHQWLFGSSSNHPGNLNNTALSNAAAISSPFTINMAREWTPGGAAVNLTITVQASANFTSVGTLRFRTVMVEREIHFETPPGSTTEKDFYDVAIKSFPNIQFGTPLASSWTIGQTHTFTLSCTVPTYARKKTEIAFVGFIQDDGDKKVHQAYRLEKVALTYDAAAVSAQVEPVCTGTMAPTVVIKNNGTNAITNLTLTPYINGVAANVTQWTGSIPSNGTTSIVLDPITTTAPGGVNTFSFAVTGVNGGDFDYLNDGAMAKFIVVSGAQTTPVVEGFVSTTFPPAQWGLLGDNNGGLPWDRISGTGLGGYGFSSEAARMRFYTTPVTGDVQEMVLPAADLSGPDAPLLDFYYAYAQKNTSSNDRLQVLVSNDCGANWTSVFDKSGFSLSTVFSTETNLWVPEAWEWRTENLVLTGFNSPEVLVKFVATSGGGNNLYVDDINLRQGGTTGLNSLGAADFRCAVYPSPAHGPVTISVTSPKASGAEIVITNALGQVVRTINTAVTAGANHVAVDLSDEAAGIYNAVIRSGDRAASTKFTISH